MPLPSILLYGKEEYLERIVKKTKEKLLKADESEAEIFQSFSDGIRTYLRYSQNDAKVIDSNLTFNIFMELQDVVEKEKAILAQLKRQESDFVSSLEMKLKQ